MHSLVSFSRLSLLALAAALSSLGCPSNLCLLTVNGRCEWSTCPEGSFFDDARRVCSCQPTRISLNGACLTLEAAHRYCGKGFHFEQGGCVANRCPPGYLIDEDNGYCLTPEQVGVGRGQMLSCPPGEKLVVENQQPSCVPIQQTCARDEIWDGRACRKLNCPTGTTFDPSTGSCVRFATGGDSQEYTVDLATWMRGSYGKDGENGTSAFCTSFSKQPLAFDVLPGGAVRTQIAVRVEVEGREISRANVATAGTVEGSGRPIALKGASLVQQGAEGILASLIAGGGKANAEVAETRVRCVIANASKPEIVVVPATGGG